MKIKIYRKLSDYESIPFIKDRELAILIDTQRKWFRMKFPVFLKKQYYGEVIDPYTGAEYNSFYIVVKSYTINFYSKYSNSTSNWFYFSNTDIRVPECKLNEWKQLWKK